MKNYLYLLITAFVGLALGCAEADRLMYEEDARVYLRNRYTVGGSDSVDYSFAFQPEGVNTYSMDLHFRIIGFPKEYDRPIKLAAVPGSSAQEGVHYSLDSLFIPANASDGIATLTFYRTPDLKTETVEAVLKIEENEHFKPGYPDVEFNQVERLSYKFMLTDRLSKPALWDGLWQNLFGDYSERKIVFLTQALPYSDWNTPVYFPQDQNQLIQKARIALFDYEKENGPMLDENGNRVVIP